MEPQSNDRAICRKIRRQQTKHRCKRFAISPNGITLKPQSAVSSNGITLKPQSIGIGHSRRQTYPATKLISVIDNILIRAGEEGGPKDDISNQSVASYDMDNIVDNSALEDMDDLIQPQKNAAADNLMNIGMRAFDIDICVARIHLINCSCFSNLR